MQTCVSVWNLIKVREKVKVSSLHKDKEWNTKYPENQEADEEYKAFSALGTKRGNLFGKKNLSATPQNSLQNLHKIQIFIKT